jgi:hypothetical protein
MQLHNSNRQTVRVGIILAVGSHALPVQFRGPWLERETFLE